MITVRLAKPDDYRIISEIGGRTFYETWRPVNTEEDMQAYMKKSFDPALIRSDIENTKVNTFLISFYGDEAVGYVKLRRDRTYEEFGSDKVIEIERIYVDKKFQDKKVGKAMMDHCLEIAKDENDEWIWLGVNIDNVKAIEFYKRYDFIIFGEKSFQLGDAIDNDYLMKKKL